MANRNIPRNAPCPCGSGRKYKKCCGAARASGGAGDRIYPAVPRRKTPRDRPLIIEQLQSMVVDPALIYAFEQTGLLITDEDQHQFSPEEVRRFDAALDEFHARRTSITTETLLTCSMEEYIDACGMFNAAQCEQHARAILQRLGGVDFETYLRALTEVALAPGRPTPRTVEPYYAKTRELVPEVPLADDVLGRLGGLMLRMMQLRLARHTALHGPIGPNS